MRTQSEISALLTRPGVIAVVRTQRREQVLPLCAALVGTMKPVPPQENLGDGPSLAQLA